MKSPHLDPFCQSDLLGQLPDQLGRVDHAVEHLARSLLGQPSLQGGHQRLDAAEKVCRVKGRVAVEVTQVASQLLGRQPVDGFESGEPELFRCLDSFLDIVDPRE